MQRSMLTKQATLANARATYYPMPDGSLRLARVQVFSAPRFREAGWEEVNAGKKADDKFIPEPDYLETADGVGLPNHNPADIARAVRRARRAAFDLIMCNPDLDAFATFTYAPEKVADKAEYADCYPTLKNWLSNGVQRRGLKYLCVPELTKKGDVHFHAICNADALQMAEARNPQGRLIKKHGDQVYNITNWNAGFSTAQIIRQRAEGEDPRLAVSKYIFKYMGKNLGAKIGGRYILKGGDLVTPVYAYGDGVGEFTTGSEECDCFVKEIGDVKYWEFDFLNPCALRVSEPDIYSLGVLT